MIGRTVGHYRILERLGGGGMGVVYKAEDVTLHRTVALKFLPPELSEDAKRKSRFRREARTISSLSHPNICTLHDVGEQDGVDYLVMEYLDGETLAERLTRGALPPGELLSVGIQIGEALGAAHRQGVVHRDLKPANVMLTRAGTVKLLDFGLAKELTIRGAADPAEATLTAEGVIVGTPAYMAPEQIEGHEADERTDIFALGVILYEMATGRRAFDEESKPRLMASILDRQPAPIEQAGGPPAPMLQRIVSRCLEKKPEARWRAMSELTTELRRLADSGELEPTTMGRLTRRARCWIGAHPVATSAVVVLLVVVAAILALRLWRGEVAPARGGSVAAPAPALPSLESKRVLVAALENRTGDASLDLIGKMAADRIIEVLVPTGTDVVPASVSAESVAKMLESAGRREGASTAPLEKTGAGLIIAGEYYLSGDAIRLHAKVIDAATRKLLYAVDQAEAPRANLDDAVAAVSARARDAVTHVVRIRETDPFARWNDRMLLSELLPPRYEAVVELRLAREARNRQNSKEQCMHSARAVELDPDFVTGLASLMDCHFIRGEFPEAEAIREKVWNLRSRLTPAGSLTLEGYIAMMEGRHERAVVVQREAVKLEPGEPVFRHQFARYLVHANRPAEAVRVLDSEDWGFLMRPEAQQWGVLYYVMLTSSLSALGEHERELAEARKARATFPSVRWCTVLEAKALASLGRIDELNTLIEVSMSEGTSDVVMLHAGNRLNGVGYRSEAATMWNRAVSWIQGRSPDEVKARRGTLADALINAGRLDEAEVLVREETRLLQATATERPMGSAAARIRAEAQLGVIAAMRGERAAALAISEKIGKLSGPYLFGATHYERARIAGRLGDREAAVQLLSAAIADGFFAFNHPRCVVFRDEPAFGSLRGYAPYEELIRPKG